MKVLCILGIYLLMWFLMTFICKYIDAKYPSELADDDTISNEFVGLLWPITFPILVGIGLRKIVKLVGKGMDKLIEKIINKQ